MKMGEYDTFMSQLAEVSGVPREILDKTPARALFALKSAIDERDRARAKSDPPAEPREPCAHPWHVDRRMCGICNVVLAGHVGLAGTHGERSNE